MVDKTKKTVEKHFPQQNGLTTLTCYTIVMSIFYFISRVTYRWMYLGYQRKVTMFQRKEPFNWYDKTRSSDCCLQFDSTINYCSLLDRGLSFLLDSFQSKPDCR